MRLFRRPGMMLDEIRYAQHYLDSLPSASDYVRCGWYFRVIQFLHASHDEVMLVLTRARGGKNIESLQINVFLEPTVYSYQKMWDELYFQARDRLKILRARCGVASQSG